VSEQEVLENIADRKFAILLTGDELICLNDKIKGITDPNLQQEIFEFLQKYIVSVTESRAVSTETVPSNHA
jgi:hypothetical protein